MLEKNKQFKPQRLWIVVLFGLILFMAFFSNFNPRNLIQNMFPLLVGKVALVQNKEQASALLYTRLKIPLIGVDATVTSVGLTSDGAMDVPKGPDEVAWFNKGPRPGENGSAVVAGHKGWKNNIPAVFDNLYKLRKGDKIYVEDEKRMIVTFVVREIKIYSKDDVVQDVFNSNDGKAHLNLITCTGIWNKEEKTSSERLVVFTDRE